MKSNILKLEEQMVIKNEEVEYHKRRFQIYL